MKSDHSNKTIRWARGLSLLCLSAALPLSAQTLEECQQAAERNYPLIRQYDLVDKTSALTVANIQKGWLPQVTATAQATYQSDVMSWPDQMQGLMQQMGIDLKGLKKDQYRVAVDVSQTIYDGGAIKNRKETARRQGDLQAAETEVNIYNVRRRVNEMYFGLLLLDKQIQLNRDLQELLAANEKKLAAMFQRGTAAESDYNSVKAERLNAVQQATGLESQRTALVRMLSTFCGMEVNAPSLPAVRQGAQAAQPDGRRPELKVIDARLQLADAQERALSSGLLPKLSVFAQGYYGYPGYNMFDDMLKHDWSLNGMVGARLSWNIGALYTHKNDRAKIQLQRESAENSRDVFLFNNRLEQIQQQEDIERWQKLAAADNEIIALRSAVRKAAESKLAHGIIDVNDLVREINSENAAKLQQSIHEIEMVKGICDLKYTTGEQ